MLKPAIEEKAKEKEIEGGKKKGSQKSDNPSMRTDEELARLAGVSRDTVRKVETIEKEAPDFFHNALQCGGHMGDNTG